MVSDITKRALLLIAGNQSETRKSASSADLKSIMKKNHCKGWDLFNRSC